MATLTLDRPPGTSLPPGLVDPGDAKVLPELQGGARLQLKQATGPILLQHEEDQRRWQPFVKDLERLSYNSVPPNRSFTVQVRYGLPVRGLPPHYPVDGS